MQVNGRTLVVDNYDSFTWNIVQLLRALGDAPVVLRHDDPRLDDPEAKPARLLVSPGPGRPEVAGKTMAVLDRAIGRIPVLGICLGHQAIGRHFGLALERATHPVHGHASSVEHDGRGIFVGVPRPVQVMRYHSLVLVPESLPPGLRVSATCEDRGRRLVMALSHDELPVAGLQFHPESFLTEAGRILMENFLSW